ncbi:cytochrome bd-I ubiquinol oxidase subunit CydA [Marinicauda salina]|uniref:Cytochrome bd-I ubiquinol oxidase subunit CydA n=1 Tax=Marinicauda salina TaxID=2135793 RepID=A0A2U2BSB4_9PROT|nr:cytochrome ubiquinol oxidase subunit I [Marinicauda salina]PWE16890.1 cytochrome bd-I ubiquinol oxidase subunit CydA [Marinicauda salina]
MVDMSVVELSRWQFALTAMYHFLFVPLTLGLSFILAVMESVYVMTGRQVWKDMVKFWGLLFGVNFAMGVATGITMEFEFGMNWAYYSQYVGDIFGAPLAIEGLMAFFLEATLVGLFFFGWDRMSKRAHLAVTWLMALGANLSALWILVANGWMQNPVGAEFNLDTMRMEVVDFGAVLFNPVAQAKFVHTVAAGYVTGSIFVLAISAFYLLARRHRGFARRSMTVASAFGLAGALSVVVLGDESGYVLTDNQRMKLASLEAMWETEEAPAPLTLVGFPDREAQETHYAVEIPWVLGLIATRSLDQEVEGILPLVAVAEDRIENGLVAWRAVETLRENPDDLGARERFEEHKFDLGYGMLLRRYVESPDQVTPELIRQAAFDTVPNVAVMFWSFRFMVGIGFYFIALFGVGFVLSTMRRHETRWYLKLALVSLPLPWIAAEAGWLLAEYGRQPWIIEGVLPTFLGVSSLAAGQVWLTIVGFTLLYGVLAVVEVMLMIHLIRRGPYPGGEARARAGVQTEPTGPRPVPAE